MNIPIKSRTLNEVFQEWKNSPLSKLTTWRVYWENYIKEMIEIYKKYNWWMIKIIPNDKKAIYKWSIIKIDYDELFELINKKYNIGVNLNKSRLISVDIDSNEIPPKLRPLFESTYSVITKSSHYHLYFEQDIKLSDTVEKRLRNKLFDYKFKNKNDHIELRGGAYELNMLNVLPPSYIDKRYYEFINRNRLMPLSELMELIK